MAQGLRRTRVSVQADQAATDAAPPDTDEVAALPAVAGSPARSLVRRARQPAGAVTRAAQPDEAPAQQIEIEQLIMHRLDLTTAEPDLAEEAVLFDEEIAAFFVAHLQSAEQRADWSARFHDGDGEPLHLCTQLLAGAQPFVGASQRLAHRLHALMRERARRITPGDLVAVVYRIGGQRRIALLKMDLDHRLMREFRTVEGHRQALIRVARNLLPETKQLQKCALLTPLPSTAERADFEIALLDNQAGPNSDGVAAFFYRGFLAADLAPSARRRTRLFLTASETWLGSESDDLSPAELLGFYHARREALASERIELAAFAAAALPATMPRATERRAALVAALRAALFAGADAGAAASFAVDRATADPMVRYVTLELQDGARLRIPAERFADLVRVAPQRVGGKFRLTIDSLLLREVQG